MVRSRGSPQPAGANPENVKPKASPNHEASPQASTNPENAKPKVLTQRGEVEQRNRSNILLTVVGFFAGICTGAVTALKLHGEAGKASHVDSANSCDSEVVNVRQSLEDCQWRLESANRAQAEKTNTSAPQEQKLGETCPNASQIKGAAEFTKVEANTSRELAKVEAAREQMSQEIALLREQVAKEMSAREHAEKALASDVQIPLAWPHCFGEMYLMALDAGVVLGRAAKVNSDGTIEMESREVCAQLCKSLPNCKSWSYGTPGISRGLSACSLLGSAGNIQVSHGPKHCAPLPVKVPQAQLALSVASSTALEECRRGNFLLCPSLHDAMRTWIFGINALKEALEPMSGYSKVQDHIHRVMEDARAVMGLHKSSPELQEQYMIADSNNQQVFEALRSILDQMNPNVGFSKQDVSLPLAARDLLCNDEICK